jgi:hypothetical protein
VNQGDRSKRGAILKSKRAATSTARKLRTAAAKLERELWEASSARVRFELLAETLKTLGPNEKPLAPQLEKRYLDAVRRLGIEAPATLRGIWKAAKSVGFSKDQFGLIRPVDLLAVLEAKAPILDRLGPAPYSLFPLENESMEDLKSTLLEGGGRPKCSNVDRSALRFLRGVISRYALAKTCGVNEDTIAAGERGQGWAKETFDRVAAGLTEIHGRPISPSDLKLRPPK